MFHLIVLRGRPRVFLQMRFVCSRSNFVGMVVRQKPYSNPFVGEEPTLPEILSEFEDLYPWLTRVISTKPDKGFATITEMWICSLSQSLLNKRPSMKKTYKKNRSIKRVIIDKDHVAFQYITLLLIILTLLLLYRLVMRMPLPKTKSKVNTLLKFMYQTLV